MNRYSQRRFAWWAVALVVLAIGAVIYFWPKKPVDSLNVPLGVEQAAIVTYSGPQIAVTPYKWGVAVNVRIAKVTEQAGARIYDVRYIVNRGGTFDLKDYLTAEDGTRLEGLPSFKFTGDPKLSKQLDARIQETEEVRIDVGGHYYAALAVLAVVWIIWLLLLIFYGRTKPMEVVRVELPEPTLAELLRGFLQRLEAGTLDAEAKAKMEMLLLRRWREDLALQGASMSDALDSIELHERTGRLLKQVQLWLHHPAEDLVRREDLASALQPYTVEAPKAAPEPSHV